MRRMIPVTLLVTLLFTPLHGETSVLDVALPSVRIPSILQPCDVHGIVQKLGRLTKLPVGFEGGPECIGKSDAALATGGWLVDQRVSTSSEIIDLAGLTLRQALDRVVALAPDYRWKEMNGVAVVRPVTAWDDPTNGLNQHIEPFSVVDERLVPALSIMLGRSGSGDIQGKINAVSASLTFPGGTLLDGLNALMESHHAGGWDVVTVAEPPAGYEPGPLLVIVVRANDRPYGAAASTAIPLSRLVR
jgi:hypothetical protein